MEKKTSLKEAGIGNSEGPLGHLDVRDLAYSADKKCVKSHAIYSMSDKQNYLHNLHKSNWVDVFSVMYSSLSADQQDRGGEQTSLWLEQEWCGQIHTVPVTGWCLDWCSSRSHCPRTAPQHCQLHSLPLEGAKGVGKKKSVSCMMKKPLRFSQ